MNTSCIVTIGGAPVPWTDDAVSSYSSQRVDSKVTELVPLSDGVDIFWRLRRNLLHFKIFTAKHSLTVKTGSPRSMAALVVLNIVQPFTTPSLPNNFCLGQPQKWNLPHSKSWFQRFWSLTFFTRSHSSLLVCFSSAHHFDVHSCRAFTFALGRLL